jgi:hypothetical protein
MAVSGKRLTAPQPSGHPSPPGHTVSAMTDEQHDTQEEQILQRTDVTTILEAANLGRGVAHASVAAYKHFSKDETPTRPQQEAESSQPEPTPMPGFNE